PRDPSCITPIQQPPRNRRSLFHFTGVYRVKTSNVSGFPCCHVLSKLPRLVPCVDYSLQQDHFAFGVEHVGKDTDMLVRCFQAASRLTVVARSLCDIAIHASAITRITDRWISRQRSGVRRTKVLLG